MTLKVYISVSKGLKLKVSELLGVTPTFGEVAGEKLLGGTFCPSPTIVNRINKIPKLMIISNMEVQ